MTFSLLAMTALDQPTAMTTILRIARRINPQRNKLFRSNHPLRVFYSSDLSVIFTSISGIGFLQCHAFNNLYPLVMSGRCAYVFAWRALYSHIAFLFAHWSLTEKVEHTYCNFTQPLNGLFFVWVIKNFGLIPFFNIQLFSPGCCLQLSSSA